MKIVAFSSGSFIALFPLEAFTPLGGLNERRIVDAISERHSFAITPNMGSSRAGLEPTSIVFERGVHETVTGQVAISKLSIHDDGVVVRSDRTEHAEAFFNDVTSWLIEKHGCRYVSKRPLYVSEIVVDFEAPVSNMINNYENIVNLLLSHVDKSREIKTVALSAVTFELTANDAAAVSKFLIERRVGTTVEDERYFCSAPFTTEGHLEVLQEIERLFS